MGDELDVTIKAEEKACKEECFNNKPCNMIVYDKRKGSCVQAHVKGNGDVITLDGQISSVKTQEEVMAERGDTPKEIEKEEEKIDENEKAKEEKEESDTPKEIEKEEEKIDENEKAK